MKNNTQLIKLAIDASKGAVENYSKQESSEVLKKAMLELAGYYDSETNKIDRKVFRKNQADIFEVLEEILNETINEGLQGQFDKFVEYRYLPWGDTVEFSVPEEDLYRVAEIVDGDGNIRRQQLIEGEKFTIPMKTYGVKIFDEFHRFLAGRIDWATAIKKISDSFAEDLKGNIYRAMMSSYGKYDATYHFTGTADEDTLITVASHIEARTGEKVAIFGTKMALRKIKPDATLISDEMRNSRNATGFFGTIAGIDLFEIPNSHAIGTDNFIIGDDFLLLIPQNPDKMIKVVNEGDAIIQQTTGGTVSSMVEEYAFFTKFGVSVITSKAFGFIKLS